MEIIKAKRIEELPPYLFARIDQKKAEAIKRGVDIIDLSIGDPDLPTPPHIVEAAKAAVEDTKNHAYPSYSGLIEFRGAVSEWYEKRFGVRFDPETEVISLIGSKEGIAHLPLAYINPGDIGLIPDPAYPVYNIGVLFAGGRSHFMPLLEENGFLPVLGDIPEDIAKKARVLFINYPNNPTSAPASEGFFEEVVDFAQRYNIIVCHDAAYTEIYFGDEPPISFLQVDGASEVGIEFHSLSKTYNMTGWRIGWAVGNRDIISGLGRVKSNIDSGVFNAVQVAAMEALKGENQVVEEIRRIYQKRREILVKGLEAKGIKVFPSEATFYVWIRVPDGFTSSSYAGYLLDEIGLLVTPGNGFGYAGEGYVRISLTTQDERLEEAVQRIKGL